MTKEQAKQELKLQEPIFLRVARKKANGHITYICPSCNNGSGESGTGIALDTSSKGQGNRYKCFKCGISEDIVGLYKLHSGIQDDREVFNELYTYYGIQTEREDRRTAPTYQKEEQTEKIDFTQFYLQANKEINKTDYLVKRGISKKTIDKYKIGYIENWKHPKAPNTPTTPRIIIPISRFNYLARDTREEIPQEQASYKKSKVKGADSVRWIFNIKEFMQAEKPVIVVEGEIDALSIIECGGSSLAIGGVSNIKQLIELLEEMQKNKQNIQPLVISLDNDEAGQNATNNLISDLERLKIDFIVKNICGNYKDANELLTASSNRLKANIQEAEEEARQKAEENRNKRQEEERERAEREAEEYKKKYRTDYLLNNFWKRIEKSQTLKYYPTGFRKFDELIDGGLYSGLYCIGAISSLGKTTFSLQILDYIASCGNDVLIFALEMSKDDLIAKSVSRHTLLKDLRENNDTKKAKTVRGIMTGARWQNYSDSEKNHICESILEYGEYGERVYIYEGIGNIGVTQVREAVEDHIRLTGNKPVVLIDYLQILAPYNDRATDKQNTDKAVIELKRLSRDFEIPVICISSFNRDNYTAPVSMASFKESGAVEYSVDVLIGLQYKGMEYQDGEKENERNRRIRELKKQVIALGEENKPIEIDIKVLKNRFGSKGISDIKFYPMFNYFTEKGILHKTTVSKSKEEKIKTIFGK